MVEDDDTEIDKWFDSMRRDFKRWYLDSDNPWRQSGWGSTPERWRLAREVILSAVERSGTFLDIGCANGLLLECLIAWARERGIEIEPHGIDLVPELIDLARKRLPAYASNFAAANAFTWRPKRRYDYVHLLLECAPPSWHREFLQRILESAIARGGRLIVSNYGSRSKNEAPIDVAGYLSGFGFAVAGSAAASERDGFVLTRTAWIDSR
ncbi:MAG TPA: methyltransferase domain-containing protein [Sporolactobacillaceae bacterium]|nr:methyltransferase domain-containing protein [Sporolactobacillaceae bacterium]